MDQQSYGRTTGPDTNAASDPAASDSAASIPAGSGEPGKAATGGTAHGNNTAVGGAQQAVLGPFTVRDLTVFAATLILFIASLLPLFGGRYNLWNLNNQFFLGLGIILPLVVSALFVARRLTPQTKIRIGSLSVDQFASVTASFALAFFFLATVAAFSASFLAGLIGAGVLFAATVLGRFLPFLSADFQGRTEVPAHVVAREAAVPVRKPRAPKAPQAAKAGAGAGTGKTPLGGRLLGGRSAGSSAVKPGAAAAGGAAPAAHAGVPDAGYPADAAAAGTGTIPGASATPVSSAPEVSEWTAQGEQLPATQATAVVRPANAPAGEQTQLGDVVTPAAAAVPAHDGGAQQGAPAVPPAAEPPAATAVHPQVRAEQQIGATVDPASRPDDSAEHAVPEAFWFAVAQPRTAVDPDTGAPAFVIEPGGWVLALEDRGHEFLVQHTDGRLGVLRDLSNIERG